MKSEAAGRGKLVQDYTHWNATANWWCSFGVKLLIFMRKKKHDTNREIKANKGALQKKENICHLFGVSLPRRPRLGGN